MENPGPNTKQSSVGYIVSIVILALATTGLLIALLVVLLAKGNSTCVGGEDDNATASLSRSQRDTQRKDDISRFLTAANDFQANNAGKTPWASGNTNEKFVTRYIDADCSLRVSIKNTIGKSSSQKADYDDMYNCDIYAKEFRDPDGSVYSFHVNNGASDLLSEKYRYEDLPLSKIVNKWPNEHRIVVVPRSICSDRGEGLIYTASDRTYSLAYRLESGKIYCTDNH